ncbi:hypothetical protein LshimejAT787_0803120 [Lyophyllum shimeji]|uniref:Uncharacterized protein n=1 Tax=Lyophyllum shimeji TaxID=47721 RepID=A0A9P3PSD5_LYOSH|nr:hypothetical protein LshimejAT787_0803120 [Lyophyllum shimeji]
MCGPKGCPGMKIISNAISTFSSNRQGTSIGEQEQPAISGHAHIYRAIVELSKQARIVHVRGFGKR